MAKRRERSELVAGTFIVVAGALIVVVLLMLANWRSIFEHKRLVGAVFADQSVKGLSPGSQVEYNGVPIGEVTQVDLDYKDPRQIKVVMKVPSDLELYANASIFIGTPALGSTAWIQIEDIGSSRGLLVGPGHFVPLPSARPATQGDQAVAVPLAGLDHPIYGNERPNALIADMTKTMGFGDPQRTQVQETIAAIADSAARLRAMFVTLQQSMVPKMDRSLSNVEELTASGKGLMDAMAGKVPAAMDHIDRVVAAVDKLVGEQGPVIADTLKKIDSASGTLDEGVKAQLANVQAAMARIQEVLAQAKESMENVRQFTGTARDLLASNRDGLNDTLANFKEGSDQFAAALSEIRREPWRLLHRPSNEEMAQANVMEAARAFAEGATNLRDATTRVSALVKLRGDQLKADDPQYQKLLRDLEESRLKFDKAEKALYQALKVKP